MRTALCLHGYYGTVSTGDFESGFRGYEHLTTNVLSKGNVDVFIHNWQPEIQRNICKIYQPKSSTFEPQVDFKVVCKDNGIDQSYTDQGFPRSSTMYLNATFERILSFYYSRCQSLKLCFAYQKEHSFEYDWVITSRFDIGQRGGGQVNQLKFDPTLDPSFFYTAHWDQINVGYGDMWHYANSTNMQVYSRIYDQALLDFKPQSEYEKCLVGGWFDSNWYNLFDTSDPRQFTNELFKPQNEKSSKLMTFPRWRASDSHLHHKWFANKNGLYQLTKWI